MPRRKHSQIRRAEKAEQAPPGKPTPASLHEVKHIRCPVCSLLARVDLIQDGPYESFTRLQRFGGSLPSPTGVMRDRRGVMEWDAPEALTAEESQLLEEKVREVKEPEQEEPEKKEISKEKSPKRMSRTKRWQEAANEALNSLTKLEELQGEYSDWRETLPESLESSALSEKLDQVIDLDLESVLDIVQEAIDIDLPLGFGRD